MAKRYINSLGRIQPIARLLFLLLFTPINSYCQEGENQGLFHRGILGKTWACYFGKIDPPEFLNSGSYLGVDYLIRTGNSFYLGIGTGYSSLSIKNPLGINTSKRNVAIFPIEIKGRFSTKGISWAFIEAGAGYYSFFPDETFNDSVTSSFGTLIGAGVMLQATKSFNIGISASKHFITADFNDRYPYSNSAGTSNLGYTTLLLDMTWRY